LITPPAALPGKKSGRTSRSIRFTIVSAANASTRASMPRPNVTGQFDTSVNPWS
jgi:hypothetical protein